MSSATAIEISDARGAAFSVPPLKFGLILDGFSVPEWTRRAIELLLESEHSEVAVVVISAGGRSRRPSLIRRLVDRINHAIYYAVCKIDELIGQVQPDAFHRSDISGVLKDVPVIQASDSPEADTDALSERVISQIKDYGLDVAVRFGAGNVPQGALDIARFGVWSYHHDDEQRIRGGPPGFWEIVEGHRITAATLERLTENPDGGEVLYKAYSPTTSPSIRRNMNNYFWKSSNFLAHRARDLRMDLQQAADNGHPYTLLTPPYYPGRLYKKPGNFRMALTLPRLACRYIRRAVSILKEDYWRIAFKYGNDWQEPDYGFSRYTMVKPGADSYYADPFPVRRDGKLFIFFEEFQYSKKKGRISALEVRNDGIAGEPFPVIDTDYHMSYPIMFEWEGNLYMLPETRDALQLEMWKCEEFPHRWTKDRTVMKDAQVLDPTMTYINGKWWLFACIPAYGTVVGDELHLFYGDSPLGPWTPHNRNPVKSDVRSSRPAGNIIHLDNGTYRPAQNGAGGYGSGLVLNRIDELTPDNYRETHVTSISPSWNKRTAGVHTINAIPGITVIDVLEKRFRWGRRFR